MTFPKLLRFFFFVRTFPNLEITNLKFQDFSLLKHPKIYKIKVTKMTIKTIRIIFKNENIEQYTITH